MTRDEALDRAVSWLAAVGVTMDDLVIIRDTYIPASHWLSTRPHDHWFVAFESLFADPDLHPNTLLVLVDDATGAAERGGLL